jgi:hypothetical protein
MLPTNHPFLDLKDVHIQQDLAYPKFEPITAVALKSAHLELMHEYHLHGIIESMAVIRPSQDTVDSILLSFNEAKVSCHLFPLCQNLRTHTFAHPPYSMAFVDYVVYQKMSLVKFNQTINSMETTSLHFFERDDLKVLSFFLQISLPTAH